MKYNNKSWYSIIISIMLIWFLIILTSGTFNLVLWELNDTKWRFNYLKAFSAAEWSLELALLEIKNKWYWYYSNIENNINSKSVILWKDINNFSKSIDPLISYDMDSKVNSYSWSIESLQYDIIPLFFLDNLWEQKVNSINLTILNDSNDLAWNIISDNSWISWKGDIDLTTMWNYKIIVSWWFSYSNLLVNNFLSDINNNNNYLILFNSNSSNTINYNLVSINSNEFFTKPRTEIISSSIVWKYKQTLRTILDNTKYLNILKYSIYSN